jgi:FkbM family methyltransferase
MLGLDKLFKNRATETEAIVFKRIEFGGQSFELAGISSDIYFQNLDLTRKANQPLCDIIRNSLKPDSIIFDVGANIGLTTVLFNKALVRPTVYSFEPGKKAFRCLTETLRRNGLPNDRTFNFGLGETSKSVPFYEGPMLAGAHAVLENSLETPITTSIEIRTIDDVVRDNKIDKIDFIKIDVEGVEQDVINGAKQTLKAMRPRVFVEFNSYTLIAVRNTNPRDFLDELLSNFSTVSTWKDSRWNPIRSPGDQHDFIYTNLVTNTCVSDLLCEV